MGVDSGIPDFRGGQSFWEDLDHPEIKNYEDMSKDEWFERDPGLMWGLNMHQIKTFRDQLPHEGHQVLKRLCEAKGDAGWFVWTSNVDGQHQLAGFAKDRVYECHGQIHRLQCTRGRKCGRPEGLSLREELEWRSEEEPWVVEQAVEVPYDSRYRALNPEALPKCERCGALARPNLWFCSDRNYVPWVKNSDNGARYQSWRRQISNHAGCKVVVIECGGGVVIPSARCEGEMFLEESEEEEANFGCTLIRINPSDFGVPERGAISIPCGAAEALHRLEEALHKL